MNSYFISLYIPCILFLQSLGRMLKTMSPYLQGQKAALRNVNRNGFRKKCKPKSLLHDAERCWDAQVSGGIKIPATVYWLTC